MTDVQTSDRTRHRFRPPRRLVRLAAAATAGIALIASAGLAITNAAAAPEDVSAAQDWDLVWSDEFNGSAGQLPSTSNWQFDIGHGYPGGPSNWGTGEIAYHTNDPANVSMDGSGNLEITALRDGSGNWTSARIETVRSDFKAPTDGTLRIEGRLQLPQVTGDAALGYWPAFWALGSPFRGDYWNWPGIGEYDVMENVNGQGTVHGVLHCGVAPGGPCNEFNGLGGTTQCGGSCHNGFHTYSFEWDESGSSGQLRWYADGQLFHTVNESALPADTWTQMTEHAGYFILLNLAMGGAFPDGVAGHATPTSATQPGHSMLVDYVRVYTSGGSGDPDPDPTDPTDPPGDGFDAYGPIQVESYTDQSGTGTEATSDSGGGQNVAWVGNGDWLRFDDVDFGSQSPLDFVARVASGAGGGVSGLVEVRIDSRTSSPIGSFAIANTGGWQSWRTVPANVSPVTGVHDVYLTFTSGQPNDFVNVNWFHFRH
ncbi:carbohydrate-binding protein [Glycomyces sp. A-F 0318]|uniref:glycoside hydrolase family 16 protein n=1 Tax=Glycomyces amatae TaxID=2881355 RepID=UPI001E3777C9|nr:glycoside hydrolase family 16 protein [Glycomyces amatae]MCD0442855.1 carbohydrate-binding protein [Glycomyces amatae]